MTAPDFKNPSTCRLHLCRRSVTLPFQEFLCFLEHRPPGHGLKRTTDDAAQLPELFLIETPATESAASGLR